MTATGFARSHLPPGEECDRVLHLVRIGERFAGNHARGRRPGALRRAVEAAVTRIEQPTFAAVLVELGLDALRSQWRGADGPILRVDRAEEVVRYVGDDGREHEAGFRRVRNLARLRDSRKPITREGGPEDSS